jgi:hypothetical protein
MKNKKVLPDALCDFVVGGISVDGDDLGFKKLSIL